MQAERRLRAGGHPARLPEAAAQQHITLLTGQVADLALSLNVGTVESVVEVAGRVPLVQTATSATSTRYLAARNGAKSSQICCNTFASTSRLSPCCPSFSE
jgi:hypothetical protein